MVPTPQERSAKPALGGERVVISGMSGLYPQCSHIKDFSDVLYNQVNPVTNENCRWNFSHPELVDHTGKTRHLERFDAQFFKVHYRLALNMDCMGRKLLEQAYQAIYDAGINPEHLYGKKVGVYIGSCFSECEKSCFYNADTRTGFGIAGCSKTMFANRISYWLNAKGPSMAIDEACSSSIAALEQAYLAILRGECEAAIVGGANLCLHPQSSVHYSRIMKLCKDGKTKSFDQNADGCAKSEAINVLFLQKVKNAKRIYAEILHVKTEFTEILMNEAGHPKYGFYRTPKNTVTFLRRFYDEAKVMPQAVDYVEAFGSAVPEADKVELDSIAEVFCSGRREPLLVGSVMSNIGYGEAASGISAITKVLLGYHTGSLAANLHCAEPRDDVAALRAGQLRVVRGQHEPWSRSLAAVNSLAVTGVNGHVLLHGRYKPKDPNSYKSSIPHLVTISGRQDAAVQKLLDDLKSRPIDPEELALLHNIHQSSVTGHLGRGYIILDTNEDQQTVTVSEQCEFFDAATRPLWFVYSGMGSQWAGMGTQLMRVPIFANAIERCRKVLEPKGLDIVDIITSPDKKMFDNILHSFVGIAAVQIGLTDILTAMGIIPDKIIGHSVGELGCAYADGCFTAEEMILAAYCRGLVSVQTPFIKGSMAAVGMGYDQVVKLLPPEIEVACHNSSESSTISGPADIMKQFVAQLTEKGVFAKEVPCSNIAYHSRYIAEAGLGLLKYLKDVIQNPKPRSERWVSTSVPVDRWDEPAAKFSSAEYHTNNLLNPVLFEETSRLVPDNAVLVEIAPHGLLQAILKRSLASCQHVPLTRRHHADNAAFMLNGIGKLYMEGYYPRVQALYPPVQFPVSTGTPMLSHNVEWAHQEKWTVPIFMSASRRMAAACKFLICIHDDEHSYLQGHVIRGRCVYPLSAALVCVWDTLAMSVLATRRQLSVEFRDLRLHAQPTLHAQRQLCLSVTLHRGSGWFEVMDENRKVVSGYVTNKAKEMNRNDDFETNGKFELFSEDVYQLFCERDHTYHGEFRSIVKANSALTEAQIIWNDNWVTFLDGMLQLLLLKRGHSTASQPDLISSLSINVADHLNTETVQLDGKNVLTACSNPTLDVTRCGGVQIESLKFRDLPLRSDDQVALISSEAVNVPWPLSGHGSWNSENLTKDVEKQATTRVALGSARVGDIQSLQWVEAVDDDGSGIPVTVHYAALNVSDVRRAIGVIPHSGESKHTYGMDFSGITDRGQRVMGIALDGATRNHINASPSLLWPVPAHWSLEDAATVPSAYLHAAYCFSKVQSFCQHRSVLIHGGAGALGQAAIATALHRGYQVFTTVSDIVKKRFLMRLFPQLREDYIGNSRDMTFRDMVLNATNGEKCALVISCVREELKNFSLQCCGYKGTTVDTDQLLSKEHYLFGMSYLCKDRAYSVVDFTTVFNHPEQLKELREAVFAGVSSGWVRPLSRATYVPTQAARAFRLLAASQHRGRVLLRMRDHLPASQPRVRCSPARTQLMLCGDAVLALHLAERLVERGARRLCLHATVPDAQRRLRLQAWEALGVEVKLSSEDLSNGVTELFRMGSALGAVESVIVVASAVEDIDKLSAVVAELDMISRKLQPAIKYFAVVTTCKTVGVRTCLSRAREGLPATMLCLPALKKGNEEVFSWYSAVEAVEKALCSTQPILKAHIKKMPQKTLLQHICDIADIDIEEPDGVLTLSELGIEETKLPIISTYLRDTHNIALDDKDILALTVLKVRELERTMTAQAPRDVCGLHTFYSHVDPDELRATTAMVNLPTRMCSNMGENELDMLQTHLCIVPGLEGLHERFQVLCERLKLPALVLQPGLDLLHETLPETARRYVQILLERANLKNNYYLLGYECGVLTVLEMAAILEDHGLTGTVFCVGGAPEQVLATLEEQLSEFGSEEALQDAVARHMFALMVRNTDGLEDALRDTATWEQKIDICVRMLLGRVPQSAQYSRGVIQAAFMRIKQVREYTLRPRRLKSRIVVLQARSSPDARAMLQRHSEQPVTVYELDTHLAHLTQDLRCTSIINRHLSKDLLESFEQRNLCETYQLTADAFIKDV